MFTSIKHKRELLAAFTAIVIIIFGTVISWLQVLDFDNAEAKTTAKKAIHNIELLLDEATRGSDVASVYLSSICNLSVSQALLRLSISSPHIRVISLLHDGQLTCSSYVGADPYQVDFSRYAEGKLALTSGGIISPGTPILVLLNAYPQGSVATSINASYAAEYLTLLSSDRQLTLKVGDTLLSPNKQIVKFKEVSVHMGIEKSSHYPFEILYSTRDDVPLKMVLHEGWIMIGGFCILALLSSTLLWRYVLRVPTPYENLEYAIRKSEIVPFYQPIICVETKMISGVEILARWRHPSGANIPPDVFIPLAEQSGLILPLTRDLMKQVAFDLAPIVSRLPHPFHIGINISTAHVSSPEFIDDCQTLLSSLSHSGVNLVAEITERASFESTPELKEMLMNLRKLNISIALDDFGTGYSNLRYLDELPIDFLKIDKSFVSRLDLEFDSALLIDCVIDMARKLNLEIIAEGVETEFQVKYLVAKGVEYLQGYYFSKPLPAIAFIRQVVLQKGIIKNF